MARSASRLAGPGGDRVIQRVREDRTDARAERMEGARVDAARARLDHEKAQIAEAEKTASLRRVRLAKEEHNRRVAAGEQKPAKRAADRAKELAVAAAKKALAGIDATDEEKAERKRR